MYTNILKIYERMDEPLILQYVKTLKSELKIKSGLEFKLHTHKM